MNAPRGAARAAYWAVPPLFCLAVYWPGLWAWFQQDDFAWLRLHLSIHQPSDLARALFAPMAQGTIRPLSERAFFLAGYALFGLDALPFRIAALLTQFVNLLLLGWIVRRLTGSALAAFLAPLLWAANPALGLPLSWTSSFNQVLCATFLLGAFACWLRFVETGARPWYLLQCVLFGTGFGALEINVVYPALAGAHALLFARRRLIAVLPMGAASGVYAAVHAWAAPVAQSGLYAMHLDASMAATLGRYWTAAMGGSRLAELPVDPAWAMAGQLATWLLSLALLAGLAWSLWRRRWVPAVGSFWFIALLAPVLPLRDHFSDYYLTLPSIGLAIWGAALCAACGRLPARIAAGTLVAMYLTTAAPVGRAIADYNRTRSQAAARLVWGVDRAARQHPGKVILLTGVSTDLFWAGVYDKPFRLLGLGDVWLAPGAEEAIQPHPELGEVGDFVFPPGPTLRALDRGQAVVYSAGDERLHNVTRAWSAMARSRWKPALASRVDVGHPAFADQLGPGWYPIESGYRWMPQRAVVWLPGPAHEGEKLYLAGFCPSAQLTRGPVRMTVHAEGKPLTSFGLEKPDAPFEAQVRLPPELIGRARIEVTLEVDRTFSDGRPLGAAFGVIAIR